MLSQRDSRFKSVCDVAIMLLQNVIEIELRKVVKRFDKGPQTEWWVDLEAVEL